MSAIATWGACLEWKEVGVKDSLIYLIVISLQHCGKTIEDFADTLHISLEASY